MCQQILWNFKQTLPIICWWQNNAVLWQRPLSECYLPVWSGQQHDFFLDRTRIAFFLVKLLGTRFCINHGYWVTCIKSQQKQWKQSIYLALLSFAIMVQAGWCSLDVYTSPQSYWKPKSLPKLIISNPIHGVYLSQNGEIFGRCFG